MAGPGKLLAIFVVVIIVVGLASPGDAALKRPFGRRAKKTVDIGSDGATAASNDADGQGDGPSDATPTEEGDEAADDGAVAPDAAPRSDDNVVVPQLPGLYQSTVDAHITFMCSELGIPAINATCFEFGLLEAPCDALALLLQQTCKENGAEDGTDDGVVRLDGRFRVQNYATARVTITDLDIQHSIVLPMPVQDRHSSASEDEVSACTQRSRLLENYVKGYAARAVANPLQAGDGSADGSGDGDDDLWGSMAVGANGEVMTKEEMDAAVSAPLDKACSEDLSPMYASQLARSTAVILAKQLCAETRLNEEGCLQVQQLAARVATTAMASVLARRTARDMWLGNTLSLDSTALMYYNEPSSHAFIVNAFTSHAYRDVSLRKHREFGEVHRLSMGERSDHWLWHLAVDALPTHFTAVVDGNFRGEVPSVVVLEAKRQGKIADVYVVPGPLVSDEVSEGAERATAEDLAAGLRSYTEEFSLPTTEIHLLDDAGSAADDSVVAALDAAGDLDLLVIDGKLVFTTAEDEIAALLPRVKVGGLIIVSESAGSLLMLHPWRGFTAVSEAVDAVLPPAAPAAEDDDAARYRHLFAVGTTRVWRRTA